MSAPLLSLQSLSVVIDDVPVVRDVSLQLARGETLGLVGASGSGKSMTALAILQLLPPRARLGGAVNFDGRPLVGQTEAQLRRLRGRDIGMVFQEPMTALNPSMRVVYQVAETVRLHESVSAAVAAERAREALGSVGLASSTGLLERYPHELSGGQRQRVAIAIAIVMRPALLIADEPTTALDVTTQAQVLALLQNLARERSMGLILVSHDLAVIAQITDRIAVMSEGGIVEEGVTSGMLRQLKHPYARSLLAAAELGSKRHAPVIDESSVVLDVRGVVREYALARRSLWRARPVFRAVDGVSLTVHPGETVGLVGESGSGKSSLLRTILALDMPQAGEVRLLDHPFMADRPDLRPQRRSIQAVFQDPSGSLDPRWTVERVISEPFHLLDTPPAHAERRRRVAAVLEQVGLSAADARRLPHEFSGGQRQRIAVARALITEPALIVFDEAVSALDVLVRAQVLELLAQLAERLKLAYLFVSHDLNVVRAIADRVYVMQAGRIVEEGVTSRVFGLPQHAYTRALIAATPRLSASAPAS